MCRYPVLKATEPETCFNWPRERDNNGVPKKVHCQDHKYKLYLDTVALEHIKNYTYLGPHNSTTGYFHKAVNDLRDKARRAFYNIKRNINVTSQIGSGKKTLESVI